MILEFRKDVLVKCNFIFYVQWLWQIGDNFCLVIGCLVFRFFLISVECLVEKNFGWIIWYEKRKVFLGKIIEFIGNKVQFQWCMVFYIVCGNLSF